MNIYLQTLLANWPLYLFYLLLAFLFLLLASRGMSDDRKR